MDKAVVTAQRAKFQDRPGGAALKSLTRGTEVKVRGGPQAWLEVEVEGEVGVVSRASLAPSGLGDSRTVLSGSPFRRKPNPPTSGRRAQASWGRGGVRFGTVHKLGLYNYGVTSLERFFAEDPGALPTPSIARVMQATSDNEGKIEAINTWDSAILSCSLYQWTTAAGSARGELPYVLSFLKADAPVAFKTYFQDEGLDVKVDARALQGCLC